MRIRVRFGWCVWDLLGPKNLAFGNVGGTVTALMCGRTTVSTANRID